MNKLLTSLLLSVTLMSGAQAQKKENYYVKHVEFPQSATIEQKVDMAARLVPTPQQYAWQQMELTAFLLYRTYHLPSLSFILVSTPLQDVNGGTGKKIPRSLILRNWMLNNGYVPSRKPALKWCF